ncbi:MAG TPA: hypothetical protein VFN49_12505 [Candidatus Aquilonibacter sp.]|nr:hypothetical protein [Candidatus Aquilonibacter sp.]
MPVLRVLCAAFFALLVAVSPADAARQIVDLHKLDAYFALFASDSNVPWKSTVVRLDTYSSAPVDFAVYAVHPGDVLTAGGNSRPRAIDTRGRKPVATFTYRPPGGYQFQSNQVNVPLGSRQGFFVVEARRGNVGEQVWINRTRVGLVTKETPGELLVYGADLGTGRALANMRVQFVVNGAFVNRKTDAHGIVRWNRSPRPIFALAQWGDSYAFTSLLPQAPLPATIVGVRTDTAVVHAGDSVRVVGFARTRSGSEMKAAAGTAMVTMRLGGALVAQSHVPLDSAGAFSASLPVPATAAAGDYAVLAQVDGGVGGATVHVDANANGLSLGIANGCENACDPSAPVPIEITSSRGDTPVHVIVVRSPHIYVGFTPDTTPWATSKWLDRTVRTDGNGRATVMIPAPTDGLSSTYGVRVEASGATAVTRILVPTARVAVRLQLDREQQTLGTPITFDLYANEIATGKPASGARVYVTLSHGPSTQAQTVTLDADGHARGTFSSPVLGMNLLMAKVDTPHGTAIDAGQVDVVPQASNDSGSSGSSDAHVSLDKGIYRAGDEARVNATLGGSTGDALVTLESALGSQAVVVPVRGGHAEASFHVSDALGDLRVGAAFVRDGAIEWTSTPLALDAPGRPQFVPLAMHGSDFAPGASTTVSLRDTRDVPGTVIVRVSRGAPSGSALFDSAPALMAVGIAATEVSAPAGRTWHPWVDSTGQHAQVLGFVRRTQPPQDLTIEEADTQVVSWNVVRDDGQPLALQLPQARGRYTISILKLTDDGRVIASSSSVVVR